MDVQDIAKQCPKDEFFMKCDPKDFTKYDEKTGKGTATAPKNTKTTYVNC